ncbi:FMN-dependent alpha-hydroxy acid dehydrogenase [Hyphomicrobium denitrificans 1NES1]|uniref:FMN-dependent alpha-hydroxy acid dehydrogenase n=1 Tax=Hyphomicrobium denitrificans 1NES1 TaxID=670307 RepID=N0B4D4_9HYPH|nr:FMN-dependent alpha-hydroxy acid dehydrogenase [Hyphomicrobium denitrificans 1NES1]
MTLKSVACIEDLRRIAHRKVPREFMDYYESGSYSEETLHANRDDLSKIKIRQRILRGASDRDLSQALLGSVKPLPLALAPVGLTGMAYRNGEIAAARAAEKAGIPYTLSTLSICSIEDVADAVEKPFWFQLYFMKDRGFIANLIARARAAECSALVLTADLQVLGQRHRDIHNGMTVPPRIRPQTIAHILSKPAWVAGVFLGKRKTFGNVQGRIAGTEHLSSYMDWINSQFDQALSWDDVAWIKERWPGKLIIKGILDVADAREAVKAGADAIVVSNHGGRQLDGAASSISLLPRIAEAVGSETEILFDGGIRSGQDVFRALALGARACLLGRSYLYGVCAAGEQGASKAIDIIAKELDVTMALAGIRRIADIGKSSLVDVN